MTCPMCIANPRRFLTQSTNPLTSHEEVPLVYNNTFIGNIIHLLLLINKCRLTTNQCM